MKRTVLLLSVLASLTLFGKGLLPCMVYRHGLTNEQIDGILATHPDAQLRITAQDWRGIQYQLHRFDNMTNYVEQIGNSNDCAKVLLDLHDTAETLTSSNAVLRKSADKWHDAANEWQTTAEAWRGQYAVATNDLQIALADYYSASNRADRAEARRLGVVAWCEEQRDKAVLPTTKALWQQFIDKLNEEINGKEVK